ncbi:MAG: hypothetical protein MK110_11595 [Fuerstiella sp.]|nr:hypothetical protein [Fuerstiella sp.]
MKTFKELCTYFQDIGANDVAHTSKGYLAHAIGVYNDLKKWGWNEELANTGLFHSIYGTQLFQGFALPVEKRDEIRELIGEQAEFVSYLNCAMDRPHFDQEVLKSAGPYQILDRFSDQLIDVTDEDFNLLCTLHLCDWLEQVARSNGWDYRRKALRQLAEREGGIGLRQYDAVFADAPEQTWFDEYAYPADV